MKFFIGLIANTVLFVICWQYGFKAFLAVVSFETWLVCMVGDLLDDLR